MHELAICESIVDGVREHVGDARVVRVVVEVGALTAVVPDALRFSFDVCAKGTSLEGATLEIAEIAAVGRCRSCTRDDVAMSATTAVCPCGSLDVRPVRGEELRVREVELEES